MFIENLILCFCLLAFRVFFFENTSFYCNRMSVEINKNQSFYYENTSISSNPMNFEINENQNTFPHNHCDNALALIRGFLTTRKIGKIILIYIVALIRVNHCNKPCAMIIFLNFNLETEVGNGGIYKFCSSCIALYFFNIKFKLLC